MAFQSPDISILHLLLLIFVILLNNQHANSCFTHIFSFGDSNSDTGNKVQILGDQDHYIRHLPYGETYFGQPTGRFCDGRLILDFLAQAYGFPLVPGPTSLKGEGYDDFRSGANFAIGGATAIKSSFFVNKGIRPNDIDDSLDIQLQWFKQLLPSILQQSGSSNILSKSLFIIGVIGGNDYNGALLDGRSFDEVQSFTPLIIQSISSTIQELIGLGARTLLIPGNFPIGCSPSYLTYFRSETKDDYDLIGCLKWLNEFSKFHNNLLIEELDKLRRIYSNATIIYADYFGASMKIYQNPHMFEFGNPLLACCGGKGPYNYNRSISCGSSDSILCCDPSKYVCWDGIHMTESAYEIVANEILHGPYTDPALTTACEVIGRDFTNISYPSTKYSF